MTLFPAGFKKLSSLIGTPALSRSIIGLLALAIVLLLSVNVATLIMNQRTIAYNDTVARSEEVRLVGKDLMMLLVDAETGQRGFMLTARSEYLDVYHSAVARLPNIIRRFEDLIGDDPEKMQHFQRVKSQYGERLMLMDETISLNRQGRIGEAVAQVRSGRGKVLMDAMRTEMDAIDSIEARNLKDLTERSERASRLTVLGNMLAGLLILGLATLSVVMVRRYVSDLEIAHREVDRANASLENQVRYRTAELLRANEEIQRFAYIVSHDLRAPLVNVMGYTSELEQVGHMLDSQLKKLEADHPELVDQEAARAVREDVPEAVGFIRASTTKMDRLINAILKMSREGRRPLIPETLNMAVMLQTMADAVRHQVVEAGGQVTVEAVPDVTSDRLIIEQVFGNLLDNAVKYVEPGRPLNIHIEGEETEEGVTYRVTDNGRGVSPRDHERIFELFRRAGTQDQPGEGLGLAFVRNSIRRLGGSIDLESELGKGSTFIVKLPKYLKPSMGSGGDL